MDPIDKAIERTDVPEWATPQVLSQLSAMAIELAITAPDPRIIGSDYAKVPWTLVERVRAQVESMGIDWRAMRQIAISRSTMGALMVDAKPTPGGDS